jgi:hypothetical protein
MFDGLYYDMMSEISRNPTNKYGTAPEMTEDERFISFLNRYFVFRKVRHVAAEKITRVIEDTMPLSKSDSTGVIPYDGDAADIENITQSLDKRAKISERETTGKETTRKISEREMTGKETASKKPAAHFIRPLGDKKVAIQTFDPLVETVAKIDVRKTATVEEVVDLQIPESAPSIQLVPNTVRIGKKVLIPTNKIRNK